MSDYDGDDDMRMTAREWFAARVVLIGGFIIAIAVAGYFTWQQHVQAEQVAAAQQAQAQAEAKAEAGPTPQQIAQEQVQIKKVICLRILVNASTSGIIPKYATVASTAPTSTNVQGRYTCKAATDVAKYSVTADLVCTDMRNPDCAKLYTVTSDDGTVLYQAKQ